MTAHTPSEIISLMGGLATVLKSEQRTCAAHGPYTDNLMGLGKSRPAAWVGCQKCMDEKREADIRASQEELMRDNAKRSIELRVGRACIPPRFADRTLSGYRAVTAEQKRALRVCGDYAENFLAHAKQGRCLLLLGNVGTGKTHLAAAIGNHVMREFGMAALYVTASSVIRHVKASFDRDSDHTEAQAYQLFQAPDLLILDEVGVQNSTEFERTVMFELINGRYEAMKPTVLISNRGKDDLPNYLGDRVMDRLRENGGKLVVFDWDSERGSIQ